MEVVVPSFFVNRLKKNPLLIHATSPRYYETKDGVRKPLCPSGDDTGEFFKIHQRWFLNSLGIKSEFVYRVHQVHGNRVHVLNDPKVSVEESGWVEADALVTHLADCPLVVLTADCVPLTVYDSARHVVGVVHAGRKGTQKRILSKAIEVMAREYGSRPQDLTVGMGPAIRGCCYEVDEPCVAPFLARDRRANGWVKDTGNGKFLLDLVAANRQEGLEAGIPPENIYSDGPCTSCENHRWYSYRKEGTTGRMMTLAMLLRGSPRPWPQ